MVHRASVGRVLLAGVQYQYTRSGDEVPQKLKHISGANTNALARGRGGRRGPKGRGFEARTAEEERVLGDGAARPIPIS